MTYYIHRNAKPKGRVSLRLCARVGSLHEEEGENGLAHFIEHLAFEGTATYGTGDIAKYLESIGTAFGADLNARTHLLETVYTFQVPVGDGGEDTSLLARGLDILSQWAGGIRISEEDVNVREGDLSACEPIIVTLYTPALPYLHLCTPALYMQIHHIYTEHTSEHHL